MSKTYCGTPEYLAPEMISRVGHNSSIDWWALGILIYEMRISVTPFFNKTKQVLLGKIQKSKVVFPDRAKYKIDYSDEFVDIIQKLLTKDPKSRLGTKNDVKEVLAHPWFKDIDIEKLEAKLLEPPMKPTQKEGEMKYFNLRSQNDVNSYMPQEKIDIVK